jgi:uncharacterized C2H2 Zn-finger protein
MPAIAAGTAVARTSLLTKCARCGALCAAGAPSIQHFNNGSGWACSTECSAELERIELKEQGLDIAPTEE